MPEYDHDHVMSLAEYLAALDPFLALVTLVMVVALLHLLYLVSDLAIRAIMREKP